MYTLDNQPQVISSRQSGELFSVQGQVVVITGAGGLGEGYARGFAENGAQVVLVSRTPAHLKAIQDKLANEGLTIETVCCDLASKQAVYQAIGQIAEQYGRIDTVLHTAASCILHPVLDDCEEAFRKNCDVNIMGAVFLCQAAGRVMKKQGAGSIVLISSISARTVNSPDGFSYGVGKAAVEMIIRWFAVELAESGVTVNGIAPTAIMTPMMARRSQDYLNKCVARIPKGRMSYADDYLGAAIFLSSEASRFMTGQTIVIDGGETISRRFRFDP